LPTVERISVIESFLRSKITSNVEQISIREVVKIIKMYVVLSVKEQKKMEYRTHDLKP
jgi:hypothetical protein